MPRLGLLKRKEIWLPTWRGWIVLFAGGLLLGWAVVSGAVPFLAVHRPLHQGVLVVEGWVPDYDLEQAKRVFEHYGYSRLLVTGVPIEQGLHISRETNYAQLARATLKKIGIEDKVIVSVVCPEVVRNRTYSMARQVRQWLDESSSGRQLDVLTQGVHARRTWLLYRRALGANYSVGVIAAEDRRYDARRWWISSSGFRTVTSELIAYIYAKFLFHPGRESETERPAGQ